MKQYVIKKEHDGGVARLSVDYRKLLNDAQHEAAMVTDGPVLVIAGAGSGKTRMLVHRAACLIERGVPPEAILLLTFTRKAAQDMMRRAASVLDDRCKRIAGGTFHSFANSVLRQHAPLLGYGANFTILDPGDAEDIMDLARSEVVGGAQRRFPKKNSLLAIRSKCVNTGRPLAAVVADDYPQFLTDLGVIARVFDRYAGYKKTRAMMDYDDLLTSLVELLEHHPSVRQTLAGQYRYIMVDEFQDTNPLQARIVHLLAGEHRNVMAVGDDAQSIYAFRGAAFANIMAFPERYAGCRVITLEQNYRSTQPILAFSNEIISHMRDKYAKVLRSDLAGEQKPVYLQPAGVDDQAAFICQRVLELHEEGVPLREIAVLFRSAWLSNELEVELAKRNIPFRKFGGIRFFEAAHVKDFLALLRALANPKDAPAWMRLLKLIEGIGTHTAATLLNAVIDRGAGLAGLLDPAHAGKPYVVALRGLHDLLAELSRPDVSLTEIIHRAAAWYRPVLIGNYADDAARRENDLDSLVKIAERAQSLEQFLSEITLEPPTSAQILPGEADDYLVLSTIHSAKGLEWHSVFLIGLVDGQLPISYALESPAALEEERRIFYVAVTRAQRNLYLMRPLRGQAANTFMTIPSRFLTEMDNWNSLVEEWALQATG